MSADRAELSVAVVGAGVVGQRVQRNLATVHRIVPADLSADVVVLARPGPHVELASDYLTRGMHVVSTTGSLEDVRELLDLDDVARGNGVSLVVGAAVAPGLSGLLARYLSRHLSICDELHIARHGTAGPACAREHHRALTGWAMGWHDGHWIERPAGSGRELCWFPEPVGARDCYRGELADPVLLHRSFPDVDRISARQSATRRDRLTARLPMLTSPHAEGGIGALRVEARGADESGSRVTHVVGIAELAGTAAAAMAAAIVNVLAMRVHHGGVITTSDDDLPSEMLLRTVLRYGVRLQEFNGVPVT
jgi:hypothetical protein